MLRGLASDEGTTHVFKDGIHISINYINIRLYITYYSSQFSKSTFVKQFLQITQIRDVKINEIKNKKKHCSLCSAMEKF